MHFDGGNTSFDASNTTLTPAVVNGMQVRFTASLGDLGAYGALIPPIPVTWSDRVIVPAKGKLLSFDAAGVDGCSGTPTTCQPQWAGDFGVPTWQALGGAEISGSTAYVVATDLNATGKLLAFDLNGQQGCTGSPVVCQPLWTANVVSGDVPAVAGGKVFVFDAVTTSVKVFDAAGQQGCAGTPVVCQPLWTVAVGDTDTPPTRMAVVGGSAYFVNRGGKLTVSDANGVTGCAGVPKVCQPTWTAPPAPGAVSAAVPTPVVADGKVFVMRSRNGSSDALELTAFDAAGVTNCGGSPTTCQPLWTSPTPAATFRTPAVADGKLYVPRPGAGYQVYDAGGAGCSGAPMTCPPLFTYSGAPYGGVANVVVANGLVLQASSTGISAYDADGVDGCTAGVCSPVAQANLGGGFSSFSAGDNKVFGVSLTNPMAGSSGVLTVAW